MTVNIGFAITVTLGVAVPVGGLVWWTVRHLMTKRKPSPSNHSVPDALSSDDALCPGHGDALSL